MVFRLAKQKIYVNFQHKKDLLEVADYIKQQQRFTAEIRNVSKWKAALPSLMLLSFIAILTYAVYADAITLEAGGDLTTTGPTAGSQRIFARLASNIGSQNALVIGTGLMAICLFYLYKALKTPPKEVVYQ